MNDGKHTNDLSNLCGSFRQRLRLALTAIGIGRILTLGIVLFIACLCFDWWLHLPTIARFGILVAFSIVLALTAYLTILQPLKDRWSDREILARIDATTPSDEAGLLELYDLLHSPDQIQELKSEQGKQLAQSAIAARGLTLQNAKPQAAINSRPVGRWLLTGLLCVLILAAAGFALPQYLKIGAERFFNPLAKTRWPHRTTIALQPPANGWAVPALEPFTFEAEVTGEVPQRLQLAYRVSGAREWTREKLLVSASPTGGTVKYTFPELREQVEFTLEGGDYTTDPQEIAVIQRPYLKAVTAHYQYPSYAGLADRTIPNGQLAGLEGTRVRLTFESSMPLNRASFTFTPDAGPAFQPDGSASPAGKPDLHEDLERLSPTTYQKELMLERSGRYRIELFEANGYREARNEVYDIRVTPDDPPEFEWLAPGKDLAETRNASLDVGFRARDKLGLSKVEFFYQIDEQPPQPLTDRITGPIGQSGPESLVRFHWDLRKMELPDPGNVRYFVRVQDNNPTGRGKVESAPGQIRLIKPSDFHLETLEKAKQLEEEARIAWRNQLLAWKRGTQWLNEGTGVENDPVWTEMSDAQQKAFAAARQIQFHFQSLTEKYERNHMGPDFMAGRLSVIAQLLTRLLEQEHLPLSQELAGARPRNAVDAAPERLKMLRSTALAKGKDHQKLATLVLEQMLRRLYDWRDLQTCTVSTRLLYEQQDEVLARTQVIAPKTIAKEIEDLKDADQEIVLTLGKQQRAIFDTETGLENQLTYLMYKAERQGRKTILDPLQAAFGNLRNNRVNYHLKRSAELIENNQPAQIIDNQKSALRALQVAQAGLMLAGQKVDPEQPITLAQNPSEEGQFDPDLIKPETIAKKDPEKVDDPKMTEPMEMVTEIPTLPEGADALSTSIRLVIELQDNVLARLRYLEQNRSADEMPRFIKLKQARLLERQSSALMALEQAAAEADKKNDSSAREILGQTRIEMEQARQLLEANDSGPGSAQMQVDLMERLKGLLQHLALKRAIEDAVAENKRLNGLDGFGRKYLLRDKDLEAAVALLERLDRLRLAQSDVLRRLERFQKHPASMEPLSTIEKSNRERAASLQEQIAKDLATPQAALSKEVSARLIETPIPSCFQLPSTPFAEAIRTGKNDVQSIPALRSASQTLGAGVQALRDLLEERVREAPMVAAKDPPKLTPELMEKLQSRETLMQLLKDEASLPPEVRERMVRALEKEFPGKYRELLQAYYGSFVTPKSQEKK